MPESQTSTVPRARIIVVGNAKGGSGKSTTAIHIAVRLLNLGHTVAMLDLDWQQRTLGRFLQARAALSTSRKVALPMPGFVGVEAAEGGDLQDVNRQTQGRLCAALEPLVAAHRYVVIDCPGNDNHLARVAHGFADTLVTPINDSFVDVDLLAEVHPDTCDIVAPGWYSEMVFAQRKRRLLADRHKIDWVVLRNRVSPTRNRNKQQVRHALDNLAPRIGFRQAAGLSDRVIYRELFLKGLTLSDLRKHDTGVQLTMTHVTAHQEIRDLVTALRLPAAKPVESVRHS